MRIHIVQKGDILYDIAKKYNVDFEELVEMNPQLSSPDMIMPGMKIKIPSESKQVRRETDKSMRKDFPAEERKAERKEAEDRMPKTTERPMGESIADDKEKKKQVRPKMPKEMEQLYPIRPAMEAPKAPQQPESKGLRGEMQSKENISRDINVEPYPYREAPYIPMEAQRPMQPIHTYTQPAGYHPKMMCMCCCRCMQPMCAPRHFPLPRQMRAPNSFMPGR